MHYFSLILSILILLMVVRLMYFQKRFNILNGVLVMGALAVVILDVYEILYETRYTATTYISFGVLILWLISLRFNPARKSS
jgi:succinate-acetate transporter protein